MKYEITDYPKPSVLKWAILVILLRTDRPMLAREIDREVASLLNISESMYSAVLENGKRYMPYRLGWERSKARKLGFIEKSPEFPRLWQLTDLGREYAVKKQRIF